jgi:hypothetical protein
VGQPSLLKILHRGKSDFKVMLAEASTVVDPFNLSHESAR